VTSGHHKLKSEFKLPSASLIVGWNYDTSKLGQNVIDYLINKFQGSSYSEIIPTDFFSMGGVNIYNDIVQFPECTFYSFPEKGLSIVRSDPPQQEWYRFLSLILDTTQQCFHVEEIYAIGGMVSLSAHTTPRQLLAIHNSADIKEKLTQYNLSGDMNYETPPGHRPTINAFLLWAAWKRNIPAVSLWAQIPFYLVNTTDTKAKKKVLDFINQRFCLGIDFNDIDEEIRQQNQMIADLRNSIPDIDESIKRLECNLQLSEERSERLLQAMDGIII